ncbi:hypothetical protein WJX73_003171 [Symbiochloris irregularis]|uniref:Glycosyltransferase 61 catalytic domain-containing protein n=1 Tax=Symbiochloris irregularis TaxID=706552 RepID=A0AAW1NVQ8_9CHLO
MGRCALFGHPLVAVIAIGALLALTCGSDQVDVPQNSTVTLPKDKFYAILHNVLLRDQSILVYPGEDSDHLQQQVRHVFEHRAWWPNFSKWTADVVTQTNATQYPDKCARWVDTPVVLWSGMPVDHENTFHWFTDDIMRVFATLVDTGLLDLETAIDRDWEPSSEEAKVILLQLHPASWTSKFHELFDHLTPDQWSFPHGVGACYRTLIVGADNESACYTYSADQKQQETRTRNQLRFRRWAMAKQLQIDDRKGHSIEQPPGPNGKIQIRLVSRNRNDRGSRAIVNEDEIMAAIVEQYSDIADVHLINFNSSLSTAMLAMNATDVLIGMHGAGMTNLLWMRPGGAVLQLMPYAWRSTITPPAPPPAATLFEQLSYNANASYFLWENFKAEHAYFNREQYASTASRASHEERKAMHAYKEHPDEEWAKELKQFRPDGQLYDHWKAQDTYVDLRTFMPLVHEAMAAVRKNNKAWAASQ